MNTLLKTEFEKIPKGQGLYICTPENDERYKRLEAALSGSGHIVFCPYSAMRRYPTIAEIKVQRIEALMACDIVIFLSGWQENKWCIMEEKIANYLGKICLKGF